MNIGTWFFLGLVIWCLGYYRTMAATRTDEILILPPYWIAVLCGYPKSKELQRGVFQTAGVWLQLTGWLLLLYGFLISISFNNPIGSLVVIFASLITSRILTSVLVKKYRYKVTS